MIPTRILNRITPRRSGRPSNDEDREKTRQINVGLTQSKIDGLNALADEIGTTRTVLLRALVDDLLDQATASRKAA